MARGATRTTLLVVIGVILVAGCSSGGSSQTKGSTLATTATTATTSPGASGADSARFCELFRTYSDRLSGLNRSTSTPAQVRQFAQDLGPAIQQAVAVAPAEIKADATLVAGAATDYLAALQRAGYDLNKVPPEAAAKFQAPDVAAAFGRLQAYGANVCGTTG
jgi:hypothetical protein